VDFVTIANRTRRTADRQNSKEPTEEPSSSESEDSRRPCREKRSASRVEPRSSGRVEEVRLLDSEVPPTPVIFPATTTSMPMAMSSLPMPNADDSDYDKVMNESEWSSFHQLSSSASSALNSLNDTKAVVPPPPTAFCVNVACIEHPNVSRCAAFS
jgi:hypothetical protein